MAKKTRMGRNLNALLGGASRNRPDNSGESTSDALASKPVTTEPATDLTGSKTLSPGNDASSVGTDSFAAEHQATSTSEPAASIPSVTEVRQAANMDQSNQVLANNPDQQEAGSNQADSTPQAAQKVEVQADSHPNDRLRMLGVDQITRGEYQPRRHFDQDLLQELADSIKAQGLIQPILVRAYGGKYELIAGERRWRASQLAGITDIPAIVRDMDDQSVAAVSLIENIQRADLNPLEEAQALERLCGEFSMTHQQVAEAVGRSRVAVTNLMRLLELHDAVKGMVDEGELDMGHARALLGAPRNDQPDIAKRIVQQGLTVRAVEKLVKDLREGKTPATTETAKTDPNIEALGQKLGKLLGAPVNIRHQKSGSGKLEISYSSIDELEGILKHIK